ncbi:MAG TPA: iron ABC transporter permease [Acidimicrobiia bacterium]|nr:iron ABC transporter permease [Acidimicrobiia bacterium]
MDRHRAAVTGGARVRTALLLLVPVGFFGVFFAYPIGSILGRGLAPGGSVDLTPLTHVFSDPGLRGIAWFTLWQAAVSTVLTLAVALPGAYVLARYEFPGKRIVRALVTVPFVLPTVVVGSAFLALGFQPSLGAILLAHVFFNYAVVVRTVGGLWSHLDPHQEEAARVLGASRRRTWWSVTLPALRPALVAAATITFLFTFTSFGVILVLGGPTRSTLETEIYRQTTQTLNLPLAAALSIVQLVAVVALLVGTGRAEGRRATALGLRPSAEVARRPRTARDRAVVGANLVVMAALLGTPVAVLVARSFDTPGGAGFGFYRALGSVRAGSVLFVPPTDAIRNSLVYALVATAIAVTVGGLAAVAAARTRRRVVDGLLSLPLGVSAVTLGFGFLIALDTPPLDLRTSPWLVPIAQALVAIPFVVRIVGSVLRSIDPRLREAAATLGAGPARVWREVDLPIVTRAASVAAAFAFAISLGEFGATTFIARPNHPTLPIMIFRLLGQPGAQNFGAAMAASTILMALTLVAVLGIDRFRVGELGTF